MTKNKKKVKFLTCDYCGKDLGLFDNGGKKVGYFYCNSECAKKGKPLENWTTKRGRLTEW